MADKIQMKTTLVEMDGDEMTRIMGHGKRETAPSSRQSQNRIL